MRKYFIIVCLLFGSTHTGLLQAQDEKEVFVDQIDFKLDQVSDNAYENEYFMTLKLNKGTSYVFKITNNQDNLPGQAILELLDANQPVLTNELDEKYFDNVSFVCNKTGFYDMLIKYKDEKPGHSIINIFNSFPLFWCDLYIS